MFCPAFFLQVTCEVTVPVDYREVEGLGLVGSCEEKGRGGI